MPEKYKPVKKVGGRKKPTRYLMPPVSEREFAIILAALRLAQRDPSLMGGLNNMPHLDAHTWVKSTELDDLCVRLNCLGKNFK